MNGLDRVKIVAGDFVVQIHGDALMLDGRLVDAWRVGEVTAVILPPSDGFGEPNHASITVDFGNDHGANILIRHIADGSVYVLTRWRFPGALFLVGLPPMPFDQLQEILRGIASPIEPPTYGPTLGVQLIRESDGKR